jgi:hypothetical protein
MITFYTLLHVSSLFCILTTEHVSLLVDNLSMRVLVVRYIFLHEYTEDYQRDIGWHVAQYEKVPPCHSVESMGTDSNRSVGAPQIVLRDIKNVSFIQSSDHQFWYKNASNFVKMKDCQVSLQNIFDDSFTDHCVLFPNVQTKNCKTCDILITRSYFKSNLNNQVLYTKTGENLTCKSSNVVYGIECTQCGLVYAGGTTSSQATPIAFVYSTSVR